MPLAEGGESISGDLKIDLRRLKNHSKQIDFSFSADLYGRCGGGEMACIQLFIDKCRWSALHRHLSSFWGIAARCFIL